MLRRWGALPDAVVACVGGGSNAIGHLHRLHRGRGRGADRRGGRRVAGSAPASTRRRWSAGRPGVLHGGVQLSAPGRERPGARDPLDLGGARLPRRRPRARRAPRLGAGPLRRLHRRGGAARLPPALPDWRGSSPPSKSSHALAVAERRARELGPAHRVLVCLSGRGDKDIDTVRAAGGEGPRRAMSATAAPGRQVRGRLRGARRGRAARDHPLRHRRLPGAGRHRAAAARLPAGGEPGGRGRASPSATRWPTAPPSSAPAGAPWSRG